MLDYFFLFWEYFSPCYQGLESDPLCNLMARALHVRQALWGPPAPTNQLKRRDGRIDHNASILDFSLSKLS